MPAAETVERDFAELPLWHRISEPAQAEEEYDAIDLGSYAQSEDLRYHLTLQVHMPRANGRAFAFLQTPQFWHFALKDVPNPRKAAMLRFAEQLETEAATLRELAATEQG
jgi:hypothetical protein